MYIFAVALSYDIPHRRVEYVHDMVYFDFLGYHLNFRVGLQ